MTSLLQGVTRFYRRVVGTISENTRVIIEDITCGDSYKVCHFGPFESVRTASCTSLYCCFRLFTVLDAQSDVLLLALGSNPNFQASHRWSIRLPPHDYFLQGGLGLSDIEAESAGSRPGHMPQVFVVETSSA